MIVVNNPGSWEHFPAALRHAAWHGLSGADFVFPFFLFISGVAMAGRAPYPNTRLARRFLVLFGLGLFLNGWPWGIEARGGFWFFGEKGFSLHWPLEWNLAAGEKALAGLRVPGVLQRIALAWLLCQLWLRKRPAGGARYVFWLLAPLLIYEIGLWSPWWMGNTDMTAALSRTENFVGIVDRWLLPARHLYPWYQPPFDPEGIWSTLSAAWLMLLGSQVFRPRRDGAPGVEAEPAFARGLVFLLGGLVWSQWEPLNKNLWTGSYSLFMAGSAMLMLLFLDRTDRFCSARVLTGRIRGWLLAVGQNPLTVYVLAGLAGKTLYYWRLTGPEGVNGPRLKQAIFDFLVDVWSLGNASPEVLAKLGGSLTYPLIHIVLWSLVAAWLARRGWRLRA